MGGGGQGIGHRPYDWSKSQIHDGDVLQLGMLFAQVIAWVWLSASKHTVPGMSPKDDDIYKFVFPEHQEENQKFTFKSRGKGRSSKSQRENQAGMSEQHPTSQQPTSSRFNLRSHSWQNFQINRKEVMDAVENVWKGVSLSL